MTKIFCDMCKEKEIIGGAPGTLHFSFLKDTTPKLDSINLQNQNLILCEECADKVAQFLIDNGLDGKDIIYR